MTTEINHEWRTALRREGFATNHLQITDYLNTIQRILVADQQKSDETNSDNYYLDTLELQF